MTKLGDKSLLDDLVNMATKRGPSIEDKFFVATGNPWDNACLSFRFGSDGWSYYVTGYKEAADTLVANVEVNQRQQDTFVYPIMFLYRHYLELALKSGIIQAQRFLGLPPKIPTGGRKGHQINDLWQEYAQLIAQIESGGEELRQAGRLIEEFARVEQKPDAFRYPEDSGGKPTLSGIDLINLRNVKEIISKIADIFDGVNALIFEYSTSTTW